MPKKPPNVISRYFEQETYLLYSFVLTIPYVLNYNAYDHNPTPIPI